MRLPTGTSDTWQLRQYHYLFYTDGLSGGGNIFAIDPDDPNVPIPVEVENDVVGCGSDTELYPCSFARGDYDSNTKIISNMNLDSFVYAKTDGKFYKISTQKSAGLSPRQISSEAHANGVCSTDVFDIVYPVDDFFNVNNSQLVYQLPGPDGECSTIDDNEWKMIRLGMNASDNPISAMQPLINLRNLDGDGSISGWLVNDAGEIRRCDENFSNCGNSLYSIESTANFEYSLERNNHVLAIDGQMFIYNGDANALSDAIFTFPPDPSFTSYVADENRLYFVNSNIFYSSPIDGSALATRISEESADSILFIWLDQTDNRLVYSKSSSDEGFAEIKAIDKAGGVPRVLDSLDGAGSARLYTQHNLIYYFYEGKISSVSEYTPLHAGIMDEDGNVQFEALNSAWIGYEGSHRYDMGSNLHYFGSIDKFILGDASDWVNSGLRLQAFGGSTGTALNNLGSVPYMRGLQGFLCAVNLFEDMLCEAEIQRSSMPEYSNELVQQDIFYLNTSYADSLQRVTDTSEISETAVAY
jgi:hypothetical protein